MPSRAEPWILGLSASHNGAACLLKGDTMVVAIQEERVLGMKRARLCGAGHSLAINYCLDYAGIGPQQLDLIALCPQTRIADPSNDLQQNPTLNLAAHRTPVIAVPHHLGHAMSAYVTSPFEDAAVLVVDGMGSPASDLTAEERAVIVDPVENGWETISLYHAAQQKIHPLEKHMVARGKWIDAAPTGTSMHRFGSLGGIFSAISEQIFGDLTEAGKVMGLAPYGTPTIPVEAFFEIAARRFIFKNQAQYSVPHNERWPAHQQLYQNLACSAQQALEEALLYLTRHLRVLTGSRNLVYAGGVALNSVANERILREAGFDAVYIMPAAEDSGPAVGAAYCGLWQLTGVRPSKPWTRDACGRPYQHADIEHAIAQVPALSVVTRAATLPQIAERLIEGRIIGWFHERSELGPRALGQRSILCDPRRPEAKRNLNQRVKRREAFRPFAPMVLREHVEEWFEVEGVDPDSPFMLRVYAFKPQKKSSVPAVVHCDGTGRVQTVTRADNPRLYGLIEAFYQQTGVPILLNTSYNVMGEPIVETPEDALWCLLLTGLDDCVLEDTLITKQAGWNSILDLCPYFLTAPKPDSGNPAALVFEVQTPWGAADYRVDSTQYADVIMKLMQSIQDGMPNGWEILRRLQRHHEAFSADSLIRTLAQLRRGRVLSFKLSGEN